MVYRITQPGFKRTPKGVGVEPAVVEVVAAMCGGGEVKSYPVLNR